MSNVILKLYYTTIYFIYFTILFIEIKQPFLKKLRKKSGRGTIRFGKKLT